MTDDIDFQYDLDEIVQMNDVGQLILRSALRRMPERIGPFGVLFRAQGKQPAFFGPEQIQALLRSIEKNWKPEIRRGTAKRTNTIFEARTVCCRALAPAVKLRPAGETSSRCDFLDLAGRRLRPDPVDGTTAEQQAKAFARAGQDKVSDGEFL